MSAGILVIEVVKRHRSKDRVIGRRVEQGFANPPAENRQASRRVFLAWANYKSIHKIDETAIGLGRRFIVFLLDWGAWHVYTSTLTCRRVKNRHRPDQDVSS
jgi:hypothetical protein